MIHTESLKDELLRKNNGIKIRESQFQFSEFYALKKSRRILVMDWTDAKGKNHSLKIWDLIPGIRNLCEVFHDTNGKKIGMYERFPIDGIWRLVKRNL